MADIQAILNAHESLFDAFETLQQVLLSHFSVERVSIFQRRKQQQDLLARFKTGKTTQQISVPISPLSIAGYVALSQEPVIIDDPYDGQALFAIHPRLRFADKFDKQNQFTTRNILCIPIIHANVLLGVIQFINHVDGFTDADLHTGLQLAALLGQQFRYELGGTLRPLDTLVHRELISEKSLTMLLEDKYVKTDPKLLMQKLIGEHRIAPADIGRSLSMHYQVPFIQYDPDKYHVYSNEHRLNVSYLKRNLVAIIADSNDKPIILMSQPNNASLIMEIERALSIDTYEIAVGLATHILQFLGESDSGVGPGEMDEILDEIGTTSDDSDEHFEEMSDDAPAVVRLVSRILHDAKRLNASDIHIDPEKSAPTRVRMRVDGVCRDINQVPASHHNAVIARIKIMANLNIAEKRIPQDGKLAFKLSGQLVEVRVATIPTVAGEGVVMRILATGGAMPIDKMNLSKQNMTMLKNIVRRPHGIMLVVGPTGSGKTTTLHAILGYLNTPDKKIWTAEDPVEITQAGLQQVQVNPKIGFTFANALRAFLRADPDIILIGEMRDKETAHAGIEASLTGHLVLSTLHTNSAPETITRLLDLGLDPVNFSDACVGILAQRLIRTLCPECKTSYTASADELAFIERQYGSAVINELSLSQPVILYQANGCEHCGDIGYKGRTGVHELLRMTPELRGLIYHNSNVSELAKQASQDGMRTLMQDGIKKVLSGITDIKQIQILGGVD
ncbi:GspE/PulE family protein [Glaciecola sp.]|nr:GspE/PulE family protein [Glaciecola sp.]